MAGGVGTERAVYTAETLKVPVLPVASFGGGSAKAHDEIKAKFSQDLPWHHLSAPWSPGRAEEIVKLAQAVGRHSYFLSYSHENDINFCDSVHLLLLLNSRVVIRDETQLTAGELVQPGTL